jgi:hypothetical protein
LEFNVFNLSQYLPSRAAAYLTHKPLWKDFPELDQKETKKKDWKDSTLVTAVTL